MAPPSGSSLVDTRLGHSLGQLRSSERDQRAAHTPRNGIAEKGVPPTRPNKALKDLNWRSRASENETDEDAVLVSSDLNLLPVSKCPHSKNKTNAIIDCEARGSLDENTQPSQTFKRFPCSEALLSDDHASGESVPVGGDTHAAARSTVDGNTMSLERENWATVKRHVHVSASAGDGPSLSIIKLQPVAGIPGDTTSSNPYYGPNGMQHVRIVRLDKRETSRTGVNTSSESRNRHITRNQSHGMGSRGAFAKPSYNTMAKGSQQHSSDSCQEAGPNDAGTRPWNDELGHPASTSQFGTTFPQQAPGSRQNYPASSPARYERLLQKLKEKCSPEPTPDGACNRNNSCEARDLQTSQDTQIHWHQQSSDINRRTLSQDLSGDSGYASVTFGHDGSDRSVSGGSSGLQSGQVKTSISNQFNPRARDFLPLNGARDPTANKNSSSESMPAVNNDLIKISPPQAAIPGYVNPYVLPAMSPMTIPTFSGPSSLLPLATNLFGGLNWPLEAQPTNITGPGLTSLMSSAQMNITPGNAAAVPASGEAGQTQLVTRGEGVATPARQRAPAVPFHHQADRSLLQVVSVPMPAGFVPPALYGIRPQDYGRLAPPYGPPRPVPKPRCPNAMAQNEYEAWIEHQKAITPGYALECRLRQQHRAQRKLQSRQKASENEKAESEVASIPEKAQSVGASVS